MKYVDAVSGLSWLDNIKFRIAKATKWGITPAMLEEQDFAYILYLLECLDIDDFINDRWSKYHDSQSKKK